jgi:hypothetical protein
MLLLLLPLRWHQCFSASDVLIYCHGNSIFWTVLTAQLYAVITHYYVTAQALLAAVVALSQSLRKNTLACGHVLQYH